MAVVWTGNKFNDKHLFIHEAGLAPAAVLQAAEYEADQRAVWCNRHR
jgi:hypothetical protein